jgi:hypothetical protein
MIQNWLLALSHWHLAVTSLAAVGTDPNWLNANF